MTMESKVESNVIKATTERSEVDLKHSLLGLETFNHDMCFKMQIYGITAFYIVCMVFEFIMFLLGEAALKNNKIVCKLDTYLVVTTELGGLYMMC